jgi:hypothetical protein
MEVAYTIGQSIIQSWQHRAPCIKHLDKLIVNCEQTVDELVNLKTIRQKSNSYNVMS